MDEPAQKPALRVCADARDLESHDDDELMQLARAGLTRAFALLIRRHEANLVAYCARRCGTGAGEEVAQEVFLAVWDARTHYEPRGHFRSFLFTIAERRCMNVQRSVTRANKRARVAEETRLVPDTPLESLLTQERQRRLHRTVAMLPEDQQRALYLRYSAGLDYDDIAAVTGRPAATVRQRVFVALAKLRTLVRSQGEP